MSTDIDKERLELVLEAAGLDFWENNLVTGEVPRRAVKTFAELVTVLKRPQFASRICLPLCIQTTRPDCRLR